VTDRKTRRPFLAVAVHTRNKFAVIM